MTRRFKKVFKADIFLYPISTDGTHEKNYFKCISFVNILLREISLKNLGGISDQAKKVIYFMCKGSLMALSPHALSKLRISPLPPSLFLKASLYNYEKGKVRTVSSLGLTLGIIKILEFVGVIGDL